MNTSSVYPGIPLVMSSACRMVAPLVSRPGKYTDELVVERSFPSSTSCRMTVAVMVW